MSTETAATAAKAAAGQVATQALPAETSLFVDKLLRTAQPDMFTMADLGLAMVIAALLAFVLAHVYRYTHRGTSYSQSFIVTMFIMAVATSVVMLIIGSNIARAFSLVGALSVIRFRTAVKDARDTGYLFAAMIAGMGCGTQFYSAAIAMVAFLSLLMVGIYKLDFGIKGKVESILRVTASDTGAFTQVEAVLSCVGGGHKLINRIIDVEGPGESNVYVIQPNTDPAALEQQLGSVPGVVQIAMYTSDQHAPF